MLLIIRVSLNIVTYIAKLDIHIRSYMTKLLVDVDDDLNKEFRDAILAAKGWNKGVIKEALREAIEGWIKESKKPKEVIK